MGVRTFEVVPYDNAWPAHFDAVREILRRLFPEADIEHIGSTAVPGLVAKPVIDVMLGANSLAAIEERLPALRDEGWTYVAKHEAALPMRRYFTRPAGATPPVHLHAVVIGSTFWCEHLAFRDALRRDPALMARYALLKTELAARFAHDRAAYTDAKGPFIAAAVAAARP